ncbi:MAG: hypothetical protein IKR39_08015 [Lachnospiraceae bacterium]|nr:hypothetical protein [Lachnospiraceae bacterium]
MKKGYVTVFFSIAIYLCLSLFIGLMYGARESALRARTREAAEVSLRSVFGEYQKELWQEYNLIFVDATYGYETESFILPEEHYVGYLNENFDESGTALLGGKDLLKLSTYYAETDEVRLATDNNGAAVRAQAINFMKHKYAVGYIEELFESTEEYEASFSLVSSQEEISEEVLDSPVFEEWKEAYGEVFTKERDVSLLSTLRLVCKDADNLSGISVDKTRLCSQRSLNQGNSKDNKEFDLADNLFFKEYLIEYTNNYLKDDKDTVLSYETEYLIAGEQTDSHNLEAVVNKLLLARQAMNMAALYKDEERINAVRGISEVVAAATTQPELAPALEASIVSIWSFAESLKDVKTLLNGGKVPLFKTPDEWRTTIKDIYKVGKEEEYDNGLSYTDYLRIFVNLVDTKALTKRFMDICELNVRKWTDNERFRLDYCFDKWAVTAYVQSEYGYQYTIKRQYDME